MWEEVWGQRQGVIREGGAGLEEGLGLFLKTHSQKAYVLVLMSQKHVAKRGDRTSEPQRPPPSATLAGRCTHRPSPRRQVRDPGTHSAFQGRAGSFQL